MKRRSCPDNAGNTGKLDLTASQTRTWLVPLENRRNVCIVLKSDASANSGFASLALKTQAHGDCDKVTLTPVLPTAQQTYNAGGIGGTHGAAFSDAVAKGNGYVCYLRSAGYSQDTGTFIALPGFCGYPATYLEVVATMNGAGATVTGSELIVFEELDHGGQ